jgi:ribonuclease HIII
MDKISFKRSCSGRLIESQNISGLLRTENGVKANEHHYQHLSYHYLHPSARCYNSKHSSQQNTANIFNHLNNAAIGPLKMQKQKQETTTLTSQYHRLSVYALRRNDNSLIDSCHKPTKRFKGA